MITMVKWLVRTPRGLQGPQRRISEESLTKDSYIALKTDGTLVVDYN